MLLRAVLAAWVVEVECRSSYQAYVPNAGIAPDMNHVGTCSKLGHTTCSGGSGGGTAFGQAVSAGGSGGWQASVCAADDDGDGHTNGDELGDPCCLWSGSGSTWYNTDLGHPGSSASKPSRDSCKTAKPAITNWNADVLTTTSATISWNNPTNHCVCKWVVSQGGTSFDVAYNTRSFTKTGLTPGQTYTFTITPWSLVQGASATRTITTPTTAAPTTAPTRFPTKAPTRVGQTYSPTSAPVGPTSAPTGVGLSSKALSLPAQVNGGATFGLTWELSGANKDTIKAKMTLTSTFAATGYVSLGFTQNPGKMYPSDSVTCFYDGSNVRVKDQFMTGYSAPTDDATQDATLVSSATTANTLTCTFSRKLSTGDTAGKDYVLSGSVPYIWAAGSMSGSNMLQHPGRGSGVVNFQSGEAIAEQQPPALFAYSASVALGVAVVVFVSGGLVVGKLGVWALSQKRVPVMDVTISQLLGVVVYLAVSFVPVYVYTGKMPEATGLIASFNLATVYLPTAKNSIWAICLGISFERAIKFHRWVARLSIVTALVHGILMIMKYNDAKHLDHVFSAEKQVTGTVPLYGVLAAGMMLILLLSAFETIRRKFFDVFFNIHQLISYLVAIFACLHHIVIVYTLALPLALVLVDFAIMSFKKYSSTWELVEASSCPDNVTKLVLKPPSGFKFEAGQFCFLSIPQVSAIQEHPFSISSAEHDKQVTFHIKNMGDSQFTGVLNSLANKKEVILGPKAVKIHGPYGSVALPSLDKFSVVVMVAGGVGVTPFASLFKTLQKNNGKTKCILVWSSRNAQVFSEWFQDGLKDAESLPKNFDLRCFNTAKKGKGKKETTPRQETEVTPIKNTFMQAEVEEGRPNVQKIISQAMTEKKCDANKVAVLACGPPPMVAATQDLCMQQGYWFHKETFLL